MPMGAYNIIYFRIPCLFRHEVQAPIFICFTYAAMLFLRALVYSET